MPNSPKTKNLIPQGATGISLEVRGKVLDTAGAPIKDAVIHVWLADPRGIYDNQDKQGRPLKLPPNQQKLRGQVSTDAQGDYSFRSLRPGNYPLGNGQMRPAHIHILIEAPGYKTLITQLYFADDPFNQKDLPGPGFFQPELVIQLKTAAPGAAVNLEGEFHFVLETN